MIVGDGAVEDVELEAVDVDGEARGAVGGRFGFGSGIVAIAGGKGEEARFPEPETDADSRAFNVDNVIA